mmetsp:Transcript_9925/g.22807  ORF Transcript_9925/g.22807 Transcript_9925/m.22807 type:complete len:211 (-) Transcript_9925:2212-2844(-)
MGSISHHALPYLHDDCNALPALLRQRSHHFHPHVLVRVHDRHDVYSGHDFQLYDGLLCRVGGKRRRPRRVRSVQHRSPLPQDVVSAGLGLGHPLRPHRADERRRERGGRLQGSQSAQAPALPQARKVAQSGEDSEQLGPGHAGPPRGLSAGPRDEKCDSAGESRVLHGLRLPPAGLWVRGGRQARRHRWQAQLARKRPRQGALGTGGHGS